MGPIFNKVIILFALATGLVEIDGAKPCQLQWSANLPSFFPLISNQSEIVYPKDNGSENWSIQMNPKTSVQIGCSEAQNLITNFQTPEATLTCDGYGRLSMGGVTPINFADLGCTTALKEKVVRTGSCYKGYDNVDIMFKSSTKNFTLISLCHNPEEDDTIMAHHIIRGAGLNSFEVSNKRPSFKEGSYYTSISADDSYGQKSQLAVVGDLLGSLAKAASIINPDESFYFARGHLAPDGDFVHIYEQNATYYFLNVVPQWQAINNGNWKSLEIAAREYAVSQKTNLKVWTGGKGVLTLNNEAGSPVEIHLAKDSTGKKLLPVPQVSWKVLHNTEKNAAVAVFMINNPHMITVPQSLIFCPDICSKLSWVTWPTQNIQKGYTYCCDMASAKAVLPMVPDLGNVQILA